MRVTLLTAGTLLLGVIVAARLTVALPEALLPVEGLKRNSDS